MDLTMKLHPTIAVLLLCACLPTSAPTPAHATPAASAPATSAPTAAPNKIALLIGIGTYTDPALPSLSGPSQDVAALKDVLIRRWDFTAANIQTLTTRQDTTRANILKALTALQSSSRPGDEVLVYYSGHGTSKRDPSQRLALPDASGAWVPSDFTTSKARLQDLVQARVDLKPIFTQLENEGRKLWIIADSCFSGQAARSLYRRMAARAGRANSCRF